MRKKFKHQQELDFYPELETEKSRRYHVYNQILLDNPQIAELALEDLNRGLKNPDTGCEGISAEQVVRILIVKCVKKANSLAKLAKELILGDDYYFPNHSRAVKKLNRKVSNLKGKGAASKRKKMLKSLIGYGRQVKGNTQKLLDNLRAEKPRHFEQKLAKKELVSKLSEFLGWFENVLLQAEERIITWSMPGT